MPKCTEASHFAEGETMRKIGQSMPSNPAMQSLAVWQYMARRLEQIAQNGWPICVNLAEMCQQCIEITYNTAKVQCGISAVNGWPIGINRAKCPADSRKSRKKCSLYRHLTHHVWPYFCGIPPLLGSLLEIIGKIPV